jgi:Protein of unknown function (DUF3168)
MSPSPRLDLFSPTNIDQPFGLGSPAPGIPSDLVDAIVALVGAELVPVDLNWFGTGMPEQPVLPYADLAEPDEDDSDLNTYGDRMAEGHLEITCYASTKKAARLLGDQVAAAIGAAVVAGTVLFAAGTLVYLRQSGRAATPDPDPAPGGGDCWDETRQFHFLYSYALE